MQILQKILLQFSGHYQQKGLNWLSFLDSLGFGACLADDMGLGKTIQILGFLSILRIKEPDKTSLLIIPASLISNWENEIQQFLPRLKYYIAHPGYIKKEQNKKTGTNNQINHRTWPLLILLSQPMPWPSDTNGWKTSTGDA